MKFTETPYFILKEYFTDDYRSIDYTAFPNTNYYKSITWENILFSSRLFDGYNISGSSVTISGSINSIDYYTENMLLSAGTDGGVYFYDRRDPLDRERIKFNMSYYSSDEGNIYVPSISGTGKIVGATNGIVVKGGGGVEDLYIKNNADDDLETDKQKGFIPLKFSFVDIQDENYIRISVHNEYNEFPGETSNIMEGSNVSGGYFVDYDTVKYNNVIVGREVYFRKDSMFHDWLLRFAQEVILEKYDMTIDIRGYVNTDKLFIYLGKIYEASTDELGINYIIEYYGLKDYILSMVPPHQRTPNLKEFINIAFDSLYHNVYTRQKDGYTLYDPSEIDIKYLGYIAKYYGFPDLQPIVIEEGIYREFVSNIIHLLKRKGTFSDLYAIWGATTQTHNRLNVYERWIPSGNPSITDTTRVVQEDEWEDILYVSKPEYDVSMYTDGAGVGWYADYDVIDVNNIGVCGNNIVNTTSDFPDYPTDRYKMDDMILSSNYRIELDINTEPLSENSILSKATFDGLYDSFETIRPVYRACRYSIVFAPLVDLTGDLVDLYGSKNFIGEKYDNTYVHSNSFITDYIHTNSYIGLQCVSSTEWVFHLEFDTPNIVVQCYDLDFNLLTPLNTTITSAGDNVLLTFKTEQTGYVVVKKTNKSSINETIYGNQIIPIEHSLNRSDLLVQVYYMNPYTYNQTLVDIEYIKIIDDNNIEINIGEDNLHIKYISVHISTNETPIVIMFETNGIDDTCIIDHDLDSRFILVSTYDDNDMTLYPDIELLSITSVKLSFTEPTTGYVSILNIGNYDILQSLIGYDENNIQTSPTYNIYDGNLNILETGIISEFKRDLNYNYLNWNLDYSSEYNDIATIEILNNEDVKFRTVISDLYKPPDVDFYIHYRILKASIGHIIEWNDNYYIGNETDTTLPTNQCGVESTISISTNIHPSVLTWSIESNYNIIFASKGALGDLLHTLDNPNPDDISQNDYFGSSVAITDNYTIVGAYGENNRSGKAYIYSNYTGNLLHTLNNPNPIGTSDNDYFGYSVAISNNYAIVGAYPEDGYSGKAYIFSNATGELIHTLDNPNAYGTSAGDQFGSSVAISNNYTIVGAYQEDDAGGNTSGKAYIFSNATGLLLHTLDNPNAYGTSTSDYFGENVAISDNYAIIGARYEDDAGGLSSGKAYIFSNATGELIHTLDNPNAYGTSAYDYFGSSVAITDNYAIVGAYGEDDAGGLGSGKAYIFSNATGELIHTLDNPNAYGTPFYDTFGNSVSISNNYAIVGAINEDDAGGYNSGKAYIFDTSTGNLLHTLDNPNAYGTSADDYFGVSVAITDNYTIVGAYGEDDAGGSSSGKAYIFNASTGVTSFTGYNPDTDDYFVDPLNPDLHVVTVDILSTGAGDEEVTIKVGSGNGSYIEKTVTTVYEGLSFISFDSFRSDNTIYPYETADVSIKTDGEINELVWDIRPDEYVFVGEPTFYNGGATHVVSAGGLARETCVVSVSGCVFSDIWAIENTFKESFETTWEIAEDDKTITLPLPSTGTYDFVVNWGDGNTSEVTSYNHTNITHTYTFSGTKHISINGVMTAFSFNGLGDCLKLISVDSGGQTELDDLNGGFNGCANLVSIPNTAWTTYVTNMDYMLYGCTSFNAPLTILDTSSCLSMTNIFANATLFNQDISKWDLGNCDDISGMFSGATSFNQPSINNLDVSNVTDMNSMFLSATSFNAPLSAWDVSNVTDMSSMFESAISFNQPLNPWDVSSVTLMTRMFYNATLFNQPLGEWNVSNVTDMSNMLVNTSFSTENYDLTLSGWGDHIDIFVTEWETTSIDTSITLPLPNDGIYDFEVYWGDGTYDIITSYDQLEITHIYDTAGTKTVNIIGTMTKFGGIYGDASTKMTKILESGYTGITSLNYAFYNYTALTSVDGGTWTEDVTDMSYMFYNCSNLISIVDDLQTGSVTDMNSMFLSATSFNAPLSAWDVSNVTDMSNMLVGTSLSTANYDSTLIGWAQLPVQTGVPFSAGTTQYTIAAEDAHYYLDVTKAWTMTDGGMIT